MSYNVVLGAALIPTGIVASYSGLRTAVEYGGRGLNLTTPLEALLGSIGLLCMFGGAGLTMIGVITLIG